MNNIFKRTVLAGIIAVGITLGVTACDPAAPAPVPSAGTSSPTSAVNPNDAKTQVVATYEQFMGGLFHADAKKLAPVYDVLANDTREANSLTDEDKTKIALQIEEVLPELQLINKEKFTLDQVLQVYVSFFQVAMVSADKGYNIDVPEEAVTVAEDGQTAAIDSTKVVITDASDKKVTTGVVEGDKVSLILKDEIWLLQFQEELPTN